jgi:signal transduction histidine kinase
VLNILKNAEDNFDEKQIEDAKILIKSYENKNFAYLSITDNGGGISDEILPSIFDEEFSTKDEDHGTGLGLYMSKYIVEKHHHGQLKAQNQDEGVRFTLRLPKHL